MWIILLDRSGSMARPFRGSTEFAGRSTRAVAEIKLEAAKGALRERLAGMRPSDVALFAFGDTAELIFQGRSDQKADIEVALDQLVASGGTDIAGALDAARAHAIAASAIPLVLLVVTDGECDQAPAEQAAEKLAAAGAMVSVLLIDPTEEGERLARAILVHGEVQAVTHARDLKDGVDGSAATEAELASLTTEVIAKCQEDTRTTNAARKERLGFTAGCASTITSGRWELLAVYLHTAALAAEVSDLLRKRLTKLGRRAAMWNVEAASTLSRGVLLRLVPRAADVEVMPVAQELVWSEDIQLHVPGESVPREPFSGAKLEFVDVYAFTDDGPTLLVGQIPFASNVKAPGPNAETEGDDDDEMTVEASLSFESVFASHSSANKVIVRTCVAAYQALGIHVHLDEDSMRGEGGRRWWISLQTQIRASDLFMLFWSTDASQSKTVTREWQFALELSGRLKSPRFIRPVMWEPAPPAIPPELTEFHVERLDVSRLHPGASPPPLSPGAAAGGRPAAVFPLLPGCTRAQRESLAIDASFAVQFLEDATRLRYYPVPTILVDDHIVRAVRSEATVDLVLDDAEALAEAHATGEVAQAVAMGFHTRFRGRLGPDLEEVDQLLGKRKIMSADAYGALLFHAESIFYAIIRALTISSTPWRRTRDEMAAASVPGIFEELDLAALAASAAEVIAATFDHAAATLEDRHLALGSQVSRTSWERFAGAAFPDVGVESRGRDQVELFAHLGKFAEILRRAGARLQDLGRTLAMATGRSRLYAADVTTSGIFLPSTGTGGDRKLRTWAAQRSITSELTLPGTNRVLYCVGAGERFAESLCRRGLSHEQATSLARRYQRSVLIHEHFHAIVATGFDAEDGAPTAPSIAAVWDQGSLVNESLAAWMEFHAAREDPDLRDEVWSFIRAGTLPAWPYRGAEQIEERFHAGGIDAVREVVSILRRDPIAAMSYIEITRASRSLRRVEGPCPTGPR